MPGRIQLVPVGGQNMGITARRWAEFKIAGWRLAEFNIAGRRLAEFLNRRLAFGRVLKSPAGVWQNA